MRLFKLPHDPAPGHAASQVRAQACWQVVVGVLLAAPPAAALVTLVDRLLPAPLPGAAWLAVLIMAWVTGAMLLVRCRPAAREYLRRYAAWERLATVQRSGTRPRWWRAPQVWLAVGDRVVADLLRPWSN